MYLRLMWDQPPDDANDELVTIETAFRDSPFQLYAPPQKHPRGGFAVHIDCSTDDAKLIAKLLRRHNLLSVV